MTARIIARALLAGVALLSACALAEPPKGDKVVTSAHFDPDMAQATQEAQATLDSFLAIAAKPPADTGGFKLKVAVEEGRITEHFWVIPFAVTAQGFEGTLANEPARVHNVTLGQVIKFGRKDISDWGYTKAGRQVGSFTVCAMFKKMSKEDVKYYRDNYGFDC